MPQFGAGVGLRNRPPDGHPNWQYVDSHFIEHVSMCFSVSALPRVHDFL